MSVAASGATTSTENADVSRDAFRMSDIERFFHLLRNAKSLIKVHGPYTTYSGTTVFSRAPIPHESSTVPSVKDIALSLAAAQDSIDSTQPEGPAIDDLALFRRLWETAITILEELFENEELGQDSFGWGIFGLASGYMHPPANNPAPRNLFLLHKYRLHAALTSLPSMDSSVHKRNEYVVTEKTKIQVLVKARRDVHLCAILLLQQFRQEEWRRVRWWHAVAVTERWIERLDLVPADMAQRNGGELLK